MLKSLHIQDFRGFRDLRLNLKPVTVITGANNVGKTAVLEALYLLCSRHNTKSATDVHQMRNIGLIAGDPREAWGWLLPSRDLSRTATFSVTSDDGVERSLEISVEEPSQTRIPIANLEGAPGGQGDRQPGVQLRFTMRDAGESVGALTSQFLDEGEIEAQRSKRRGTPPCYLLTPFPGVDAVAATMFTKLQDSGRESIVAEALRILDSRIEEIRLGHVGGHSTFRCRLEGDNAMVPLTAMGSGMGRLLAMILQAATLTEGLLLFDEIESGFHHSRLEKIWQALQHTVSNTGTQIVATTHSYECLTALSGAFAHETDDQVQVLRLEFAESGVAAVEVPLSSLAAAIEHSLEVR